jgi:hypothetical protein
MPDASPAAIRNQAELCLAQLCQPWTVEVIQDQFGVGVIVNRPITGAVAGALKSHLRRICGLRVVDVYCRDTVM